jgi:hypothetical protein
MCECDWERERLDSEEVDEECRAGEGFKRPCAPMTDDETEEFSAGALRGVTPTGTAAAAAAAAASAAAAAMVMTFTSGGGMNFSLVAAVLAFVGAI